MVELGPFYPDLPDPAMVTVLDQLAQCLGEELLLAQVFDVIVDRSFPSPLAPVLCEGVPDLAQRLQLEQVVGPLPARSSLEAAEGVDDLEPLCQPRPDLHQPLHLLLLQQTELDGVSECVPHPDGLPVPQARCCLGMKRHLHLSFLLLAGDDLPPVGKNGRHQSTQVEELRELGLLVLHLHGAVPASEDLLEQLASRDDACQPLVRAAVFQRLLDLGLRRSVGGGLHGVEQEVVDVLVRPQPLRRLLLAWPLVPVEREHLGHVELEDLLLGA